MQTQLLFLKDHYLKEWDATVLSVKDGKFVALDKSAFYYTSGGQPHDTGSIIKEGLQFKVVFGGKFDGEISYEVDTPGLAAGDKVHCIIDWERRYTLMRMHTAAHIIAEAIHKKTGALITGNQLGIEESRIDFSLENFDRAMIEQTIALANEVVKKDLPVTIQFLSREEADKIPQVSKLAKGLPAEIKEVRIVSIGDFDIQADGGTQVAKTSEIGKIELIRCDNKGKNNRRMYFRVV